MLFAFFDDFYILLGARMIQGLGASFLVVTGKTNSQYRKNKTKK